MNNHSSHHSSHPSLDDSCITAVCFFLFINALLYLASASTDPFTGVAVKTSALPLCFLVVGFLAVPFLSYSGVVKEVDVAC